MADDQLPYTEINATLTNILSELKGQKRELSSLEEDVRENCLAVSSDVKKLKIKRDLVWKYEGNTIQYKFNLDLEDTVKQIRWGVDYSKSEYVDECISEAEEKLKNRNKLIRITDSSEGGWEKVRQYEAKPLADDSEDESWLKRAESRAIHKKSQKRPITNRNPASYSPYHSNAPTGASTTWKAISWNSLPPSFQRQDHSIRVFRGQPTKGQFSEACFACGSFSHFRKNCPHMAWEQLPPAQLQSEGYGTAKGELDLKDEYNIASFDNDLNFFSL